MFRRRSKRIGKPKRVSYELIPRDNVATGPMYALLAELVDAHHRDLREASIVLAWCTSWRPDVDGRVILGKCKKASDLDRELTTYDFVILLSRSFWRNQDLLIADASTSEEDRNAARTRQRALLDHELMHACVKFDDKGEPVYDERGRKVYRVRKHDLEEFVDVVKRHGIYKSDIEAFAKALGQEKAKPFKPCATCVDHPGWVPVLVEGVARLKRCDCYVRWVQQKELLSVSA
jgi:hypothetical protein